jgi:hypothetical protein
MTRRGDDARTATATATAKGGGARWFRQRRPAPRRAHFRVERSTLVESAVRRHARRTVFFVSGYYAVGERGDGGVVIGRGRRRGVGVGGGESGDNDDDGEAEEEVEDEEEEEIGGNDNDLGQGKVWAKLTDGAKDAGANTGGDGSLVNVMMRGGARWRRC